jgi:hypothetical protein
MQGSVRSLAVLVAAAGLVWVAACSSSSSTTATANVSLAGTYTLKSFSEAGQDLSQVASGTAALTSDTYSVNIQFAGNVAPAIVDSGSYTATAAGSFSQTSKVTGQQATGTYTNTNGVLTVNITAQGVPVVQVWQKQ